MPTVNPDTNVLERMTGFGNPELFHFLKGKNNLHMDDTFFTVPHPFSQLIVVMVHDEQVELHVPVLCVLVTDKSCAHHTLIVLLTNELNTNTIGISEWVCWHVFHWTLVTAKLKFDPACVYLDFEKALTNAARDQFKDAILIDCFFSFQTRLKKIHDAN